MFRSIPSPRLVAALCTGAILLGARPSPADEPELAKILADLGPAFVTVKFVLKVEGQFGNRENEAEITGVMIDPSGLVLCGNTRLGSPRMMRSMGGSATPTDIKVLIGDDTEGLPAKVLARDSELDLAWVKIKKPGDRKFACLNLSHAGAPAVGQRLVSIRKMAKYFDRAMTVSEGRLAGKTRKPRDLLVPSGGMSLEPGLPVFTSGGEVVGVVVVQMPEDEELQSMAFTGIGRDISTGLILPAAEVLRATARAREAKADDEDDSDEPAPAEAKTGAGKAAKVDNDDDDAPPPEKGTKKKPPSDDSDEDEDE
jgi:S1-C subfamily serine protease